MNQNADSEYQGKLWGGRFDRPPNELFYEFQKSFPFDQRLLPYELAVDKAWARALERAGILTAPEMNRTLTALDSIAERVSAEPVWLDTSPAEDIHHFVEMALVERLGPLGYKLHTARSRNELIATDFRLFVKGAIRETALRTVELAEALVDFAERSMGVPIAGMTHMQHAQPLLFSHVLLGYSEGFLRDLDRLAAGMRMADCCPLGSGALGGTALPVDRSMLARTLGFSSISANSVDAVGDRDFALDYLYALAVLATHLSHLAEDFILFASQEFNYIWLPDEYSTGSSLMPQKKNPDAWELLRGKTGRIVGALTSLFVTLKGLPSSYQRDLQEDKEAVFAAHDQATAMVRTATGAISATRLNIDRLCESARDKALLATEAAHYLVRRGLPFRQAHEIVGCILREAERCGVAWTSLPLAKLRSFSPLFDADLHTSLTIEAALESRDVPGGTAPKRVREALVESRGRLAERRARWENLP